MFSLRILIFIHVLVLCTNYFATGQDFNDTLFLQHFWSFFIFLVFHFQGDLDLHCFVFFLFLSTGFSSLFSSWQMVYLAVKGIVFGDRQLVFESSFTANVIVEILPICVALFPHLLHFDKNTQSCKLVGKMNCSNVCNVFSKKPGIWRIVNKWPNCH